MLVVYVAGRFRGPTAWAVRENVHRAERAAVQVAELGAMPLCPHANTAHCDGLKTAGFWIDGTLELMRRCDVVYVFEPEDLHHSAGTRGEVNEAMRLGIPVAIGLKQLIAILPTVQPRAMVGS